MKRLDIFIHQPVSNARASKRVRDATATPADIEKAKKILGDHETSSEEDIRWARRVLSRGENGDGAKDTTGRHHPETGGRRTPIADTVRRILDGRVFARDQDGWTYYGDDGWYYQLNGKEYGPFIDEPTAKAKYKAKTGTD